MVYYKIGQIAKMMGVSTHLLKHYEKFGLIHPVKNEESNYRYYEIGQCAKVIECKKYRNMGFSLQEITEIVGGNSQEIEARLEHRMELLEEEIRQLEYMKRLTRQYQKECEEVEDNLGEWYIEKIPGSYFLRQSENEKILEKNSCQTQKYNLIDLVPLSKSMLHLYTNVMDSTKNEYEWGIYLCPKSLSGIDSLEELHQLCIGNKYLKIDCQKMFVTYVCVDTPYINNDRLYGVVQEKYSEFCDKKVEEFFAIVVKSATEDGVERQYFKVYVPFDL